MVGKAPHLGGLVRVLFQLGEDAGAGGGHAADGGAEGVVGDALVQLQQALAVRVDAAEHLVRVLPAGEPGHLFFHDDRRAEPEGRGQRRHRDDGGEAQRPQLIDGQRQRPHHPHRPGDVPGGGGLLFYLYDLAHALLLLCGRVRPRFVIILP